MIFPMPREDSGKIPIFVSIHNSGPDALTVGWETQCPTHVGLAEPHDQATIKTCRVKVIRYDIAPGSFGIAKLLSAEFWG